MNNFSKVLDEYYALRKRMEQIEGELKKEMLRSPEKKSKTKKTKVSNVQIKAENESKETKQPVAKLNDLTLQDIQNMDINALIEHLSAQHKPYTRRSSIKIPENFKYKPRERQFKDTDLALLLAHSRGEVRYRTPEYDRVMYLLHRENILFQQRVYVHNKKLFNKRSQARKSFWDSPAGIERKKILSDSFKAKHSQARQEREQIASGTESIVPESL